MVKMTKAQLLEQVQLLQQQLSHQPPQLQGDNDSQLDNDVAATTTPKKHIEFGMERTPIASPGAEDDVEVLEDLHAADSMQQNKRKVEIDLEMQRQRQMRKKQNPDLAAGLNNLGEALASGLIEAANVKNSRSSGVDMSEQMTKLLDLMEETKASIDQTNDVNDKMLQFLQGKF
ncbi:hypothetical protein DYB30_005460 [Aphanomyces astaci]|uniref:Uncharacterized protein n=1 Tax=Aphanomyces astaci TaxID=112090 RepID=A0A397D5Z6_APHAT|nr:hypothetical protein DYB30_005460 [Aphanomyces astaci]